MINKWVDCEGYTVRVEFAAIEVKGSYTKAMRILRKLIKLVKEAK